MTASAPRFDIVIPTYRRAALLVRTIESALAQTADAVRVTVADNASEDDTEAAVRRFGARVRYRRFDEHLPYQRNMSRAKELIEAPFGLVLHDDDLLDADYAAVALAAFERRPEAAMVVQHVRALCEPDAAQVPFVSTLRWARALGHHVTEAAGPAGPETLLPPGALRAGLSRAPWMCPYWPGVSLRRDAFAAAGPYDPGIRTLIDVEMWMRIGERHAVVLLDRVGASYRFHAGSMTTELGGAADDVFVQDVLHIHAKERRGDAAWRWTDDEAARWLSFALHRVATEGDAACAAVYDALRLAERGVPAPELRRLQLDARLLWRRTLAPDRGVPGALADLWTRARMWRLARDRTGQ